MPHNSLLMSPVGHSRPGRAGLHRGQQSPGYGSLTRGPAVIRDIHRLVRTRALSSTGGVFLKSGDIPWGDPNTNQAGSSGALLQRKEDAMAGPIPFRLVHVPDIVHIHCGTSP